MCVCVCGCACVCACVCVCHMFICLLAGSTNFYDCVQCTAGYYCQNARGPEPSGPCDPGYYCTGGATQPRQRVAEPGFHAPGGSAQQVPCPVRTSSNATAQAECDPCPPGYFCPDPGLLAPIPCGVGQYCPPESDRGLPCPPGTYSPDERLANSTDCLVCPAGLYCAGGESSPSGNCSAGHICFSRNDKRTPSRLSRGGVERHPGDLCQEGYYCPEGTVLEIPCPAGTYSATNHLSMESECLACEPGQYCNTTGLTAPQGLCSPGYFCFAGSSTAQPVNRTFGDICPLGNYCPSGAQQAVQCAHGMYANVTGLAECLSCPPGFECSAGMVNPSPCPLGHYCPGYTSLSTPHVVACPEGFFNDRLGIVSLSDCTPCSSGQYCVGTARHNTTGLCAAGYWCGRESVLSRPNAGTDRFGACNAGHYCPEGSSAPLPCPAGTYRPELRGTSLDSCRPCPAGQFCGQSGLTGPSGDCLAGWYCSEGSREAMPGDVQYTVEASGSGSGSGSGSPTNTTVQEIFARNVSYGGICPKGHYCPTRSARPLPCVPGYFSNTTGLSSCTICPSGYFCSGTTVNPLLFPCPSGHYCPAGLNQSDFYPCPAGTFNPLTARRNIIECTLCTAGYFCDAPGLSAVSGDCEAGFYCPARSTSQRAGICPHGFYCPARSPAQISCPAGQHCNSDGLAAPSGNCSAGYFCTSRATTARPTDGITGNLCPSGHYCPERSPSPIACDHGTYAPNNGSQQESDCVLCPVGQYCSGLGLGEPTGFCSVGYYCPLGQNSSMPNDFICPAGHQCRAAAANPDPCPSGFYQNETGQGACEPCPPGYFCDSAAGGVVSYEQFECPVGYYCPAETPSATHNPCPLGTFSNITGLFDESNCTQCTPGMYCGRLALTEPDGLCSPGFYCPQGRSLASTLGFECPQGSYCPEGTSVPEPCPPGTLSTAIMLSNVSQCEACPGGKFCAASGLTHFSGYCAGGYYCPPSSYATHPQWVVCPIGHFCPVDTARPQPCPRGTFSNRTQLAAVGECTVCSGGQFCGDTGLLAPSGPCDGGYYCHNNSDTPTPSQFQCPPGSQCPVGSTAPQLCPDGTYTASMRTASCSPCPAGSQCPVGSKMPTLCPRGQYCPGGTGSTVLLCPRGTFRSVTGAANISDCSPCTGGRYCGSDGLVQPTGPCASGYYCRYGSDREIPAVSVTNVTTFSNDTLCITLQGQPLGDSGICPEGHYCLDGTTDPFPCPAGNYSSSLGQSNCDECPAGFFCPNGTSDFTVNSCPEGHYCPAGTQFGTQFECPPGTFNNATGGLSSLDCLPCTPGYFCSRSGLSHVSGPCDPGFYCSSRATSATPLIASAQGGRCPVGNYCPRASPLPVPCSAGSYCHVTGLALPTGPCRAGFFCNVGSQRDDPPAGLCSPGYFCPEGSSAARPCPPGTFSASTRNTNLSDCQSCTPGRYCEGFGLSATTGECRVGFFCPGRQSSPTPSAHICSPGHHCRNGSSQEQRCPRGYYQDLAQQGDCKQCPVGYYCDSSLAAVSDYGLFECPSGHYCLAGTRFSSEYPCPIGTFSNSTGNTVRENCVQCSSGHYCNSTGLSEPAGLCSAGYFCRSGAMSATPTHHISLAHECPTGHFCALGTVDPKACPVGTFNPSPRQRSLGDCRNCTGGYFCNLTGLSAVTAQCDTGYFCDSGALHSRWRVCDRGAYCPLGSAAPLSCPPGSYNPQEQGRNISACLTCPAGSFCNQSGLAAPSGLCSPGYFCPAGSTSSLARPCRVGLVCPYGLGAAEQSCAAGTYTNRSGQAECVTCPSGFSCIPVSPSTYMVAYQLCIAGHYCPAGTGDNPSPCPSGTYSSRRGLGSSGQCTPCDGGRYCGQTGLTSPSGSCSPGYFCSHGVNSATPQSNLTFLTSSLSANLNTSCSAVLLETSSGYGGRCPVGHFCPTGSAVPLECAAGTYANVEGQAVCSVCPSGHYCPTGTSNFTSFLCPMGHFCPNGTRFATESPCRPGTYQSSLGGRSVTACRDCSRGMYCATAGLVSPTGNCSAGWYCTGGSDSPNTTIYGGRCSPGRFCPMGSFEEMPCTPGYYCASPGLPTPTAPCSPGYYCTGNATSSAPVTGSTGGMCPQGHYCPMGSSQPLPCPPGTYLNSGGNVQLSDCINCPPGNFCAGFGLRDTTGFCSEGYYCPRNQSDSRPSEFLCPVGYFCPMGSVQALLCPSGFYQPLTGQSNCSQCPAGHVCDNSFGIVSLGTDTICPAGHFCPAGVTHAAQFPCPAGTYSNSTSLHSQSQCLPCPGGYICHVQGTAAPDTLCPAGFFCRRSASSTAPSQGEDADRCPLGFYCPEGTQEPRACPAGTLSNSLGLVNASQCTPCPAGVYCLTAGERNYTGSCAPGYYCPPGSSLARQVICPVGRYCPRMSPNPIPCPAGTFSSRLALQSASQCSPCTSGWSCNDTGLTSPSGPCSPGYYCPEGSSMSSPLGTPCPVGSYCPVGSPTPLLCTNGTYTNATTLAVCIDCPAGWYCLNGLLEGKCPMGFYCPSGTALNWRSCPRGTYNSQRGLATMDECSPCDGGHFCAFINATSPTGPCDAGHYCQQAMDRPDPVGYDNTTLDSSTSGMCPLGGTSAQGIGGICPVGHYCPLNSTVPLACPAGSFANVTGLALCHPCPSGFYCLEGATHFMSTPCQPGYFCPAGTTSPTEFPCTPGTYNGDSHAFSNASCLLCKPGMFCDGPANIMPSGNCSAGFYCGSGSATPMPMIVTSSGGPCLRGTYCPPGSRMPIACPPGRYCLQDLMSAPTGDCLQGYFCSLNASRADPTDAITGDICPSGHYCPNATSTPQPCPPGTFFNATGAKSLRDCLPCTPGSYCMGSGLSTPTGLCFSGYYCPGGENTSSPESTQCRPGYQCPRGSADQQRCPSGMYQDQPRQATCKTCLPGFFCDQRFTPIVLDQNSTCPPGYYCPSGTMHARQWPCPSGTYSNSLGLNSSQQCTACSPGNYCFEAGLSIPTGQCAAGFFCVHGARSSTPSQGPLEGDMCPPGRFCPEGTASPVRCAAGSYSNATGLRNQSECTPCDAGMHCQTPGLVEPTGPCAAGSYCPVGSLSSSEQSCSNGSFCPSGTPVPVACPVGTFSSSHRLKSASECTNCTPGMYCAMAGQTAPTGPCDPGFFCPGGDKTANPFMCWVGHQCAAMSSQPMPCHHGSFANTTGKKLFFFLFFIF